MSKVNGYSFDISTPFKMITNLTPSASSNSTVEVKLSSILVPANTFGAGDVVRIDAYLKKTGIVSGYTMRMYWNTADSISSPTPLTLGYDTRAASNLLIPFNRTLGVSVSNGTGTATISADTVNIGMLDISFVTTSAPETKAIDWTADGYIIIAAAVTNASDSILCSYIRVYNG